MNLTRVEQETVILMNAAESAVEVYTADPVYMRKFDKLCEAAPENWKLVKQNEYSKTYSCSSKKLVSFRTKLLTGLKTQTNPNSLDNLRKKNNRSREDG